MDCYFGEPAQRTIATADTHTTRNMTATIQIKARKAWTVATVQATTSASRPMNRASTLPSCH